MLRPLSFQLCSFKIVQLKVLKTLKLEESSFHLLVAFLKNNEDRPLNFPAWDIRRYHKEMQLFDAIKFDGCEIISSSSIMMKFTISSSGHLSSEKLRTSQINQTITFSENSPFIDFVT